jgi:hypothetical protein
MSKRIGNAGDDVRQGMGNAGDDMRREERDTTGTSWRSDETHQDLGRGTDDEGKETDGGPEAM